METTFKATDTFQLDESVRRKSTLTVYRHMLMRKKAMHSTLKNFLMIVYFLYYRASVELGTCELTMTENFIVLIFLGMMLFSLVNQGSRLIYWIVTRLISAAVEIFWIYRHIDEIRRMRDEHA